MIHSQLELKQKIFKQQWMLFLFLLPGMVILFLFNYLPFYGVTVAFKDFNPFLGISGSEWIGIKYFRKLWNSMFFWRILKNTLIINGMKLLIGFPAPIILAILLNEIRNTDLKRTFQTIIYLPHFLSWVIVGGFVVQILSPNTGIIAMLSQMFTGESTNLFPMIDPQWFRWILVYSNVWKSIGWGSIIYIAAITGINPELYEAAFMDGANRWRQIINITIPCIAPTIMVLFILQVGKMMDANLDQIMVLYSPSVYSTGDVINTYVYREGLTNGEFSYTAAVGLFQSIIGFILLIITNTISRRLSESSLW